MYFKLDFPPLFYICLAGKNEYPFLSTLLDVGFDRLFLYAADCPMLVLEFFTTPSLFILMGTDRTAYEDEIKAVSLASEQLF